MSASPSESVNYGPISSLVPADHPGSTWNDMAIVVRGEAPPERAEILDASRSGVLLHMREMPPRGDPVTLSVWAGFRAVSLHGKVRSRASVNGTLVRVRFDRKQDDPNAGDALTLLVARFGSWTSM